MHIWEIWDRTWEPPPSLRGSPQNTGNLTDPDVWYSRLRDLRADCVTARVWSVRWNQEMKLKLLMDAFTLIVIISPNVSDSKRRGCEILRSDWSLVSRDWLWLEMTKSTRAGPWSHRADHSLWRLHRSGMMSWSRWDDESKGVGRNLLTFSALGREREKEILCET